jgi:broad specificity phosphatase PhoE
MFDEPIGKKPLRLYFIRHAQADGQGTTDTRRKDPHLTELGKVQAEHVALRLGGTKFTRIYSSTARRAKETTREIVAFQTGTPLHYMKELEEVSSDHFLTDPSSMSQKDKERVGGELDRIERFANILRHDHEFGETIAIVIHGNLIRTLLSMLSGKKPHESVLIEINNAGVSILDMWPSGVAVVQLANGLRHLKPEDITT